MATRNVNLPTRVYRGRRQVLYGNLWCDVPHGYRIGDPVGYGRKRAVETAKEILGDEAPLSKAPRYPDYGTLLCLLENHLTSSTGRYLVIRREIMDEMVLDVSLLGEKNDH